MSLITDFILLAASGTACFYCWVLNKRLKSLTDTEAGFGTGVAALAQSAEDVKAAVSLASKEATQKVSELDNQLRDADQRIAELNTAIERLLDQQVTLAATCNGHESAIDRSENIDAAGAQAPHCGDVGDDPAAGSLDVFIDDIDLSIKENVA